MTCLGRLIASIWLPFAGVTIGCSGPQTVLRLAAGPPLSHRADRQVKDRAELGRLRGSFGDPDVADPFGSDRQWVVHGGLDIPVTVYFPMGTAERRYILWGDYGTEGSLSCETKRDGLITKEWWVELEPGPTPQSSTAASARPPGSLEALLTYRRVHIQGTISDRIKQKLEEQTPCAMYHIPGLPGGTEFQSGYVLPDGYEIWSEPGSDHSPYPITPTETFELLRHGSESDLRGCIRWLGVKGRVTSQMEENYLAWEIVRDGSPTKAFGAQTAVNLAEQSLTHYSECRNDGNPRDWTYEAQAAEAATKDTLALAYYRLHRFGRAVDIEREALAETTPVPGSDPKVLLEMKGRLKTFQQALDLDRRSSQKRKQVDVQPDSGLF
jgi:hypothetical protein